MSQNDIFYLTQNKAKSIQSLHCKNDDASTMQANAGNHIYVQTSVF